MLKFPVRFFGAAVCLLLIAPAAVLAQQRVSVTWDASAAPNLAGYTLHWGTRPAVYTSVIDVGNQTQAQLPVLPEGTYFVAVRAYGSDGSKSSFSNELTVSVTASAAANRDRARGDFTGDGFADVLWKNRTNGQLAAWGLNGASVRVEAGVNLSMPDQNWEVAGTGDFNGDRRPDILWRHKLYGFLGVWYMGGLNVFGVVSLSISQVADTAWKIAAVGDVTGDGKADIVWQHDTGPVALWRMDGITVKAGSALVGDPAMAFDPKWRVVGVMDMNGDNQMDLLWQHANGWLATWMMSAGNVYGVDLLNPSSEPDLNWKVVGNIDANFDDKQDILWQHTNGSLQIWYMDGLNRIGVAAVTGGSLGGSNWKVVGPR